MKLQIASDIHTEFYLNPDKLTKSAHKRIKRAGYSKTVEDVVDRISKVADEIDGIIIPGDLSNAYHLEYALQLFCERYKNVIYTSGNHEFYGSTKKEVEELIQNSCAKYSNLHYLQNSTVTIDNQRFVGCTLWYPPTQEAISQMHGWSDFTFIQDGKSWILNQFEVSHRYLKDTVQKDDVVLTHYLPCKESIHPIYVGDSCNCYFLGDVSDVIYNNEPKTWVHGHTHIPMQFTLHDTKVYCNPLGYPNHGKEGSGFNDSLIIEV